MRKNKRLLTILLAVCLVVAMMPSMIFAANAKSDDIVVLYTNDVHCGIDIEKEMNSNMKALYIVVNAGFAEEIVDFIRLKGSTGATIINGRGISILQKEIMGISIDREKEIILTLVNDETTDKIIEAINQNKELKTNAHIVCFAMPVAKAVGIHQSSE